MLASTPPKHMIFSADCVQQRSAYYSLSNTEFQTQLTGYLPKLQALRDIYLVYKSIQLEEYTDEFDLENQADHVPRGFFAHLAHYASQYRQLFTVRRLRNALISSSTVALAQQLCGSRYKGTSHLDNI